MCTAGASAMIPFLLACPSLTFHLWISEFSEKPITVQVSLFDCWKFLSGIFEWSDGAKTKFLPTIFHVATLSLVQNPLSPLLYYSWYFPHKNMHFLTSMPLDKYHTLKNSDYRADPTWNAGHKVYTRTPVKTRSVSAQSWWMVWFLLCLPGSLFALLPTFQ